jgi:hypothetical protein
MSPAPSGSGRASLVAEAPADELCHGLGGGAPQLCEQLAPAAQERTQPPRDGQDDVAVGDLGQYPFLLA